MSWHQHFKDTLKSSYNTMQQVWAVALLWANAHTLWKVRRDRSRSHKSDFPWMYFSYLFYLSPTILPPSQSHWRFICYLSKIFGLWRFWGRHFQPRSLADVCQVSPPRALRGRWQQLFVPESEKVQEEALQNVLFITLMTFPWKWCSLSQCIIVFANAFALITQKSKNSMKWI